jgi:hypothetical protein
MDKRLTRDFVCIFLFYLKNKKVLPKEVPQWTAMHGELTREFYNKNMCGKTKVGALEGVLPSWTPQARERCFFFAPPFLCTFFICT